MMGKDRWAAVAPTMSKSFFWGIRVQWFEDKKDKKDNFL